MATFGFNKLDTGGEGTSVNFPSSPSTMSTYSWYLPDSNVFAQKMTVLVGSVLASPVPASSMIGVIYQTSSNNMPSVLLGSTAATSVGSGNGEVDLLFTSSVFLAVSGRYHLGIVANGTLTVRVSSVLQVADPGRNIDLLMLNNMATAGYPDVPLTAPSAVALGNSYRSLYVTYNSVLSFTGVLK